MALLAKPKISRALGELKRLIPEGSTISSFFLFDGSLELGLAKYNRTVVAHTNKQVVYEFWRVLNQDPKRMSAMVEYLTERLSLPELYLLQDNWHQYRDMQERATFFYILSHCSDTGYASHGNLDKAQLCPVKINSLRRHKSDNFYLFLDSSDDPLDGLATAKDTDFLLFPVGKFSHNLFEYGKNTGHDMTKINHKAMCKALANIDKKWIVIYDFHPRVTKLYKDYNIQMIDKYGNKTNNQERCEELVISNFVSV
jgi:hypothetical protein